MRECVLCLCLALVKLYQGERTGGGKSRKHKEIQRQSLRSKQARIPPAFRRTFLLAAFSISHKSSSGVFRLLKFRLLSPSRSRLMPSFILVRKTEAYIDSLFTFDSILPCVPIPIPHHHLKVKLTLVYFIRCNTYFSSLFFLTLLLSLVWQECVNFVGKSKLCHIKLLMNWKVPQTRPVQHIVIQAQGTCTNFPL